MVVEFTFDEEGGKTGAFMCITYYARQFCALRKLCSGGDNDFIQSLARCKAWEATGGKSGSAFARTLGTFEHSTFYFVYSLALTSPVDGRYVLKGISDTELRSFLSFGPAYFEYLHRSYYFKVQSYVNRCHFSYQLGPMCQIPTTLAKIVGLFSIQWRSATGRTFKQDLVVMENLFYARNIERVLSFCSVSSCAQ